jgi:hypothetical protein
MLLDAGVTANFHRGDPEMNWKRRFAIIAVPAVVALGGGAIAVHAATTPTPSPASSLPAGTDTETADPSGAADPAEAAGKVETAEPAGAPDAGHADTSAPADHQATGDE